MKRYTIWCAASHGHQPMESDSGQMVTYNDAIALARKVAALVVTRTMMGEVVGSATVVLKPAFLDEIIAEAEKPPSP